MAQRLVLIKRKAGDAENMTENLFSQIVDWKNILKAFNKALKGKTKFSQSAMKFNQNVTYNLKKLVKSLIDETYEFSGYIRLIVHEPKERIVDAPYFIDKVVQLAVKNVIEKIINPKFIYDSYACIKDKGTHKCADKIQQMLKKAKWLYGKDAFVIKIDIRKFFYTIDREVLKTEFKRLIKCEKTLRLIFKIIDSADIISLKGLPLGNTFSQIGANVYMNMLDQFAKRVLRLKFYARYADDIIIVVENKQKAKEILKKIGEFVVTKLKLEFNIKKTKMFPLAQGANAIGFKIKPTHMLLRNDSKKRIKRKIKAMPELIKGEKITISKAEQMLNSWKGHADHADSYNFIQELLEKHKFLKLVPSKKKKGKYIFTIDIKEL